MTSAPFWSDRFHWCALAAGFLAAGEGRLDDAEYVRRLAYGRGWRDGRKVYRSSFIPGLHDVCVVFEKQRC